MSCQCTLFTWICLAVAAGLGLVVFLLTRRQRRLKARLRICGEELQRFKSIQEFFDHPVILASLEGEISYWNAAAERLVGYPASEIQHQPISKLFPEKRAAAIYTYLQQVGKEGQNVRCEVPWLSKAGKEFYVALTLSPVKDQLGRINGVFILAYDISKRKRAEEALATERFLVGTLMENIPDHIYFKDRQSRFLRVNKAMAGIFKLKDPADAIGKTDFDFFLPEHARQAFEDEQQIIRTGEPLVGREEKETWPDGSVTWVSTTKVALRDETGATVGTFGISRDITDRKLAEEALALKTQELVRSNSELEHFAYAASHDLQEPLRMIASYLQLLVRRCQNLLTPEGKEFIGFAVDGAKRMQSLINDLLLYSRVGRYGKPFVTVNCEEILGRALANLQIAIQDSQAVVTHGPLPQVIGDPTQLTQLFQNLVGNAIKFRGESPPAIHIAAEFKKASPLSALGGAAGEWIFSVRDNGIGIEPQYFERIFVIFQRLHTREKYSGTGIGLAICKRIVERHGGRIWLESAPGQGSTFYFAIAQPEPAHG